MTAIDGHILEGLMRLGDEHWRTHERDAVKASSAQQQGENLRPGIVFALRIGRLVCLHAIEEGAAVDAGVDRLSRLVGRLHVQVDARRGPRSQRAGSAEPSI